jgi:3-dehydrocarnitine:acetyl-CoA trimethylamine transferase
MQRKVMIACAVTGAADTVKRNPAVPVTPAEIARSAIDAAKAGAAIVHVHVRDPETKRASMDPALYRETVERIRASGVDVLINLTTGPGARFVPGLDDPFDTQPGTAMRSAADRVRHIIELRPDICSLDVGSMNMGSQVFVNSVAYLEAMATAVRDVGVTPELEVFEAGHLLLAKRLLETGHVVAPGLFQICLGISWGQPASPEAMTYMRNLLPPSCIWFAFGISQHQFPMAAQAALLGGHIRVGLEDNLYLDKGTLAPSNAVLVERAANIIVNLGGIVASATDAREMISLHKTP